jgi:hypothetical protein
MVFSFVHYGQMITTKAKFQNHDAIIGIMMFL